MPFTPISRATGTAWAHARGRTTAFDEGEYSYVVNDVSGSRDHALATVELTAEATDLTHGNIAPWSFAYPYTGRPARRLRERRAR
jgi:predicted extracellular nuclease